MSGGAGQAMRDENQGRTFRAAADDADEHSVVV